MKDKRKRWRRERNREGDKRHRDDVKGRKGVNEKEKELRKGKKKKVNKIK